MARTGEACPPLPDVESGEQEYTEDDHGDHRRACPAIILLLVERERKEDEGKRRCEQPEADTVNLNAEGADLLPVGRRWLVDAGFGSALGGRGGSNRENVLLGSTVRGVIENDNRGRQNGRRENGKHAVPGE